MTRFRLPFFIVQHIVQAGMIKQIQQHDDGEGYSLIIEAPDGSAFRQELPAANFDHGVPVKGDYLLRYPKGSFSWLPASVFEEGYRALEGEGIEPSGLASLPPGKLVEVPWKQAAILFKRGAPSLPGEIVCKVTIPPYSTMPVLLCHEGRYYRRTPRAPEGLMPIDPPPLYYEEIDCHFVHPLEVVPSSEGQDI